jgi:hypothetical protein
MKDLTKERKQSIQREIGNGKVTRTGQKRVIKKDHREDLWGNKTLKNGTCRKI